MAAAAAAPLRRTLPARGWRRYAVGGIAAAVAAACTVTAVSATPALAAHESSTRTTTAKTCTPPPSPQLKDFTQGNVAIPGDSIHWVIGGSGPVLLLLHGWPLTWWEFHTIMPTLAKNYTVIALDLPGLGNSTFPTTGGFTAADTAVRLHEAVAALGFGNESISILGHDVGANMAYAYARLYPTQVSRVMAIETALNGYGLESLYGVSFHFLLNMEAAPVAENIVNNVASSDAYLNYLYTFVNKKNAITQQDRHVWYGAYSCPLSRSAGYDYYRAYPQDETWDVKTNTSKLTIPVAAVGGQDSFGNFVAQSFEHVDSDVHTVIAPNSGHYVAEEDPVWLGECATLFFSPAPPAKAPKGYASCLP
jgi:pimeloyl-ACP methyl ester carboxylesterase